MDYNELISKAFVNPSGSNKEEVQATIQLFMDELLSHLSNAEEKPLLPSTLSYAFEKNVINKIALDRPDILKSVKEIFDHSMNPYSPYYIGHMDSMPTVYSFLGDLIASVINNNMFSLEMSPFLTHLEYKVVGEFCKLFGYDDRAGGIILGGGSLANLQALIVARNHALDDAHGDIKSNDKNLVILCSAMAHVSIKKSAMIMGVGSENVISIPVDVSGHLAINKLQTAILKAGENNQLVMAIVATAGTTVTGNIDSITSIAKLANKHSIWLHVDAIWGGGLILSKKYKERLEGINLADSITFNPQKWMMVAKTCSLVLYKNNSRFEEYFRIKKDYVRENDIAIDLSELGIAGTKRPDVLKLWLSIQSMGLNGYELYIDHTMKMIEYFEKCASEYEYLRIAYPSETAMICMRSEPEQVPNNKWNNWNANLQDHLLKEQNTFVSLPKLDDENWLRIVLLNPFLNEEVIDNIFVFIDQFHSAENFKKC